MKRIVVLGCAALAFGFSSPLAAEQAAPPAPQAEYVPPPPPPMPPMPSADPSHRWVDIDGHGSSRASRGARAVRHSAAVKPKGKSSASATARMKAKASKSKAGKHSQASNSRKATKSIKSSKNARTGKRDKLSKSHKASASHRTAGKEKATHFSTKTVRSCHAMTYRQIMRSSSCRTMMAQELAAPARRDRKSDRASHRTTSHKAAASHSKKARKRAARSKK